MIHYQSQFYCDAVGRSSDPTGTLDIRRRFSSVIEMRFRKVRLALQASVIDRDILGLHKASMSPIAMAGSPGNKEIGFQTWFDHLLKQLVVEDGQFMRPMIAMAYNRALVRAQRLTGTRALPTDMTETINALVALCLIELQGIAEAVSQRIMRTAIQAWLHNSKTAETFTAMSRTIGMVGVNRSRAMVELMVVKAFTTGTLDQFEAAKVTKVRLIAELKQGGTNGRVTFRRRNGDSGRQVKDAGGEGKGSGGGGWTRNFGFSGPGSRISREEAPSRSTISRIRNAARALEELSNVNVTTAGDKDVCPECEDIENDNPYTIDEARSLIPAHPFCRCAFTTDAVDNEEDSGDSRTVLDYNENHDPKSGEFTSGEGGGSGGGGSNSSSIPIAGSTKANVAKLRGALSLLPQDHLDAFKGGISLSSKNIDRNGHIMGQFKPRDNSIALNTGFAQMEETLLHEMGHAYDFNSKRGADNKSPSMRAFATIHNEAQDGMTASEIKAAKYWLGSSVEAYAEAYSLAYSRDHVEVRSFDNKPWNRPPKFFGGMSRARALSVFSKSVKAIRS